MLAAPFGVPILVGLRTLYRIQQADAHCATSLDFLDPDVKMRDR
jgi:hypothetical protein